MNTIKSLKIEIATILLLTIGVFLNTPFNMNIKAISDIDFNNLSQYQLKFLNDNKFQGYLMSLYKSGSIYNVSIWDIRHGYSKNGNILKPINGDIAFPVFESTSNSTVGWSYTQIDITNSSFDFFASSNSSLVNKTIDSYKYTISSNNNSHGYVYNTGTYLPYMEINLYAIPDSGYQFVKWSDNNTDNPRTVTVTTNSNYQAIFEESTGNVDNTYEITGEASFGGLISGLGTFASGSTINLQAIPSNGYKFVQWSNGDVNSTISVNVDSDKYFYAEFEPIEINSPIIGINSNTDNIVYDSYSTGLLFYNYNQSNSTFNATVTSHHDTKYITSFDIIFDKSYRGSFDINIYGPENILMYSNTVYFNGTHVNVYKSTDYSYKVFNFQISNINMIENISDININNNLEDLNDTLINNNNSLINSIENGNTQSSSSSQQAQEQNSNLNDSQNELEDLESSFNDDMNNNLSEIDTDSSDPNNWDSSFLISASWVKEQFDNLTEDTPFGQVITFASTIGLGLLVIGRLVH